MGQPIGPGPGPDEKYGNGPAPGAVAYGAVPPPKWAQQTTSYSKSSDAGALGAMESGNARSAINAMEYRKRNATGRAFLFVNERGIELRGPNVFNKDETDQLRLPIDWD